MVTSSKQTVCVSICYSSHFRVGDHLISINGEMLKSVGETEQMLKKLPKGPVKIVAMCPPTEVTGDNNWTGYILSSNEESDDSGNGIITVEVRYSLYAFDYHINELK